MEWMKAAWNANRIFVQGNALVYRVASKIFKNLFWLLPWNFFIPLMCDEIIQPSGSEDMLNKGAWCKQNKKCLLTWESWTRFYPSVCKWQNEINITFCSDITSYLQMTVWSIRINKPACVMFGSIWRVILMFDENQTCFPRQSFGCRVIKISSCSP